MHEDLNQKISQFLDNELDQDEAVGILQKVQQQPDLKAKMSRYEAISAVLKTDEFLFPSPDFSIKVNQQIQHEPFYLLPRGHQLTGQKSFMRRNKMLAVAVSIAAVAIMTAQGIQYSDNKLKTASTIELSQQAAVEQSLQPIVNQQRGNEHYPINARINDYLQAHNSSIYTNGEANFRPFATVSAQSQE